MNPLKYRGRWLVFLPITVPDYVAKEIRDQAAALEARRAELNRQQTAIDTEIDALRANAADAENVAQEADLAGLNIVETLKLELSLRAALADLAPAIREDAATHVQAARDGLKAVEDKAFKALIEAGWREDDPNTKAFLVRNMEIQAAKRKVDSASAHSRGISAAVGNREAISAIREQLNDMAEKTLRAAGV